MHRQNFNMASHIPPRTSLPLLFSQHFSPTREKRGFVSPSLSLTASARKMWCVFVLWMLVSSDGSGGMVKMSSASASDDGGGESGSSAASPQCVLKGQVYTERLWYGYLIDKAFHRDYAKIQYSIHYPVKECCVNLLIYYDDQIKQLTQDMTCEERERILPNNNNQVIPLHTLNRTVGCRIWNGTDEPYYVCVGERIFRSSGPRTWYFALSRCGAKTPLTVNYAFNVSGYYGDCEEDPLVHTYIPPSPKEDSNVYVSLALGIVAGVAISAAIVFFALWFVARRRAANSKGSSVTSSQATMTQDDIFYVNPSLSEREQQEYGTSQASSENYYEVIPERRSYESINPHMLGASGGQGMGAAAHHALMHGHPHPHAHAHHLHPAHAHAHAHGHATHPRHQMHMHQAHGPGPNTNTQVKDSAFHRPHPHPAMAGYPMFEDYPPPPYQPPRLLGGPKHHTLHHPTPHHHDNLSLNPRLRTPLLNPTHAPSLSFPAVMPPAPAPGSLNNNTASGNNNNGNNSNNNITSTSAVSMNTTTNTVSLGETSA
ncbi:uncharacterized protein [Littorina saxatilis]|uniref:GPR180-like N-terminal domain-containing protein n=1 Tax=Littorina saxatilis TaxID=31220 RepID=A0AAN9AZ93_9CAEN